MDSQQFEKLLEAINALAWTISVTGMSNAIGLLGITFAINSVRRKMK